MSWMTEHATDLIKMTFVLSLLKETAKWNMSIIENNGPVLDNYQNFAQRLRASFDDSAKKATGNQESLKLKTDPHIFAFTSNFQLFTRDIGWNVFALINQF